MASKPNATRPVILIPSTDGEANQQARAAKPRKSRHKQTLPSILKHPMNRPSAPRDPLSHRTANTRIRSPSRHQKQYLYYYAPPLWIVHRVFVIVIMLSLILTIIALNLGPDSIKAVGGGRITFSFTGTDVTPVKLLQC